MRAAINVLAQSDDNTLIVGDMAELGSATEVEHKALGAQAAKRGVKRLLVCGKYADLVVEAFGSNGIAFSTQEELLEHLNSQQSLQVLGDTILVKGSRSARMERVVELLHKKIGGEASHDVRGEH